MGEEMEAIEAGRTIMTAGEKPTYVANGLYHDHLTRWTARFPLEHILVLSSDELAMQPAETLAKAMRFLGVPAPISRETRPFKLKVPLQIDDSTLAVLARFYEPHNRALEEHYGVRVASDL